MKSDAHLQPHDASRDHKTDLHALPAADSTPRLLFDGLPGMAYVARTDHARTVELASAGCEALLGLNPERLPFHLTPLIHPARVVRPGRKHPTALRILLPV